jgi:surface polysaccharide O-acyltransferase-like enzyme
MPTEAAPLAPTASESGSRGRVDIEILRIVAAAMVVTIHLTSILHLPDHSVAWWIGIVGNMASRSCVPIFFAVAGWAMLSRPAHADEVGWLLKRLRRLMIPLLLWDVVYIGVEFVLAQHNHWDIGFPGHIRWWLAQEATRTIVGPGTSSQLWFLYYLIPVTAALWLVRVAPQAISDRRTRTAFYCTAAALIVPFGLSGSFFDGPSWVPFGWALACAVAGFVILSTPPLRLWASAILFVGATAALVVAALSIGYDRWTMAYPGPLVLAQTIGMIGLARGVRLPQRWQSTVIALGKLTFGVYLVHLVFLQAFGMTIYEAPAIPYIPLLLGSWIAAVALSFGATALWHRSRRLESFLG